MKLVYTTLLILLVCSYGYCSSNNPFKKISYDSIVLYDFEPRGEGIEALSIINKDNQLAKTIKKSKTLTSKEATQFSRTIGQKSSYGKFPAACYEPHLGIVYYKDGKVIQHITVCMDCSRLVSSIDIPNQNQGKQISEDGEIYYSLIGMSKSLRTYLNNILIKYKFSYALK